MLIISLRSNYVYIICMCKDKLKVAHQLRQIQIERNVLKLICKKDFGVKFEPGYTIENLDNQQFAEADPNEVYYYYHKKVFVCSQIY